MAQAQRRLMARVGTAQMQAALYFNRKRRRARMEGTSDGTPDGEMDFEDVDDSGMLAVLLMASEL